MLDAAGNPVREPDYEKWKHWFMTHDRGLACDVVGDATVSTVFLGFDHRSVLGIPDDRGPPILWETMILGGPHDDYQRRYTSQAAALAGHQQAVEIAKASCCSRCGAALTTSVMSRFNTDILCEACDDDEQAAPGYARASAIESGAFLLGEPNFPGIGLSDEDKAFLAARLKTRRQRSHSEN